MTSFELDDKLEFQIIKNTLLSRKFLISILDHIKPEFFRNKTTRVCCSIIKKHFAKHSDVPSLNILKIESKEYLTPSDDVQAFYKELDAISRLDVQHEDYLRSKVLDFCKTQALIDAVRNSVDYLKSKDYSSLERDFKRALAISENTDIGLSYFENPEARFVDEMQYKKHIKTGIITLDKITGGGWSVEDTPLTIIVAPTGCGKSLLLCKFGATAILAGKKVVHITHELSEQRTAGRYDSIFTNVMQSFRLKEHEAIVKKIGMIKHVYGNTLIIKEFPTRTCTTNMITAYLSKLKDRGFVPDLIINDYLDIMLTNGGVQADDNYSIQKAISEELRALAQITKCPILTASQTNRGGSDKDIIKNVDIAESFGKTFAADLIITVNQNDNDRLVGRIKLYIAKYRNGASGLSIPLSIDYERMNVKDFVENFNGSNP